jgi:hypothetical protein
VKVSVLNQEAAGVWKPMDQANQSSFTKGSKAVLKFIFRTKAAIVGSNKDGGLPIN